MRSGAYLFVTGPACNDALVIASDPRFQVLALEATSFAEPAAIVERISQEANKQADQCPLMESISAESMLPSMDATRWRDPVYGRGFWNLPADGHQFVQATFVRALTTGRYRLDLFAGLEDMPRESDSVCEVRLRESNGNTLRTASFGASHFGETRWAILSTSFDVKQCDQPLRMTVTNAGFTGMRVQRAELRRWRIEPAKP